MWHTVRPSFCLFTSNRNKYVKLWSSCDFKGGLDTSNPLDCGNCSGIFCFTALEKGPSQQGSCLATWFPAYISLHAACIGLFCFQYSSPFPMSVSPLFWAFATAEGKLWLVKLLKSLLGKEALTAALLSSVPFIAMLPQSPLVETWCMPTDFSLAWLHTFPK